MEMSSRERVMAALNREEPDRIPRCELSIDRKFSQRLLGWNDEASIAPSSVVINPYTVEEAKEVALYLGLDNLSFIQRAPVYAHVHKIKGRRGFMGDGLIKSEADLAIFDLPDPYKDETYAAAEKFVKGKAEYAAAFVTRIGMAQTIMSFGIQDFSLFLYDKPDLVEKVLDLYFDWMVIIAERVCQLGFDFFWTTDDFAFKSGLFFSPDVFRELMVPRYKKVLDKVTIPWVIHSDGNIEEAIDYLIDLGVAGIHPIEKGAMDIRRIKQKYGHQICLLGNLDLKILNLGTTEEVDKEVRELIRDVGPGGGYILTSGNTLASYLNLECVLAMTEALKKYGQYPIYLL